MLPDTGERYLSTPLFADIGVDMDEELAISQFDAQPQDGREGGLTKMNADILAALKAVIDPELGTNIVDLELIYHASFNASGIDIALTMTTPACPLGEMISRRNKGGSARPLSDYAGYPR